MAAVQSESALLPTINHNPFTILKSDELVIGGYASIEIVDKQNDLITLKALEEAVGKFMKGSKYRNVMTNHSNVQVGEVLPNYRDSTGRLWKTGVDDVGFFVVIKLRDDIEKAREVGREIRKGSLRSFSIGGQALEKRKKEHAELGEYNEISKLELHEVTICEKGINPEAKFDILKQDVTKMSELENALNELNALLKEAKLEKEHGVDEMPLEEEQLDATEDVELLENEELPLETGTEEMEYSDNEAKGELTHGSAPEGEAGEVIHDGTPKSKHGQITVAKSVWETAPTLDLSDDNLEKAYAEFKAEQLEKLAYENVRKNFASRFEAEMEKEAAVIEKANYDAHGEVSALKEQFSELLKSLKDERNGVIAKQTEIAEQMEIPSSDEIAKMDWNELNAFVGRFEN